MFAGITFGSAVKGSPASVTSEDGEELESSLEMFDDVLGGGHGIMRGRWVAVAVTSKRQRLS